ncbi:esterase/lipase family protein [Sphingomonas arantia]|uniref:Esterase/lipase family protein n=2 Tax=Sphingomonas arantia TaxID=1460676 RepID=A0ABW4TSY3_9SPHN
MRAPSTRAMIAELGVPLAWARGQVAWRGLARAYPGDGRPVLVLPGFLADDSTTVTLRRTLGAAGYVPHGWGLGRNRGISQALLDRMLKRLAAVTRERPAAIVGWSLGGLYAREIAKRVPDLVERVVTLGSPFSGDIRANHAWRMYERVTGHAVDQLPIAAVLAEKPPVPTFALWSARDGIVAPAASRGLAGEADAAIAVDCRHIGFTSDPAALRAVLEVLRRGV